MWSEAQGVNIISALNSCGYSLTLFKDKLGSNINKLSNHMGVLQSTDDSGSLGLGWGQRFCIYSETCPCCWPRDHTLSRKASEYLRPSVLVSGSKGKLTYGFGCALNFLGADSHQNALWTVCGWQNYKTPSLIMLCLPLPLNESRSYKHYVDGFPTIRGPYAAKEREFCRCILGLQAIDLKLVNGRPAWHNQLGSLFICVLFWLRGPALVAAMTSAVASGAAL